MWHKVTLKKIINETTCRLQSVVLNRIAHLVKLEACISDFFHPSGNYTVVCEEFTYTQRYSSPRRFSRVGEMPLQHKEKPTGSPERDTFVTLARGAIRLPELP